MISIEKSFLLLLRLLLFLSVQEKDTFFYF